MKNKNNIPKNETASKIINHELGSENAEGQRNYTDEYVDLTSSHFEAIRNYTNEKSYPDG